MARKSAERATRQVTVQPEEKPPEAGQPHVPHTRVKQPGQAPPDDGDVEPEGADAGRDAIQSPQNDTASAEHSSPVP